MLPPAARFAVPLLLITALAGCGTDTGPGTGTAAPNPPSATPPSATPSVAPTPAATTAAPHLLVFAATGNATLQEVTYVVDGKTVDEKAAKLPWRKTIEIPAGGPAREWSLLIRHRNGNIKVVVTVDGTVVTQGGGGGSGTGEARFSGTVAE